MTELVSIREAARRLGVSDVALHKARKVGRIVSHEEDNDPKNGRPRLRWPQVQSDYLANSDETKRTHIGGRGDPRRAADLPPVASAVGSIPAAVQGQSLAQSKAVREAYLARLAKLDFEERSGKLVSAEEVKISAFKLARQIRDALMNIPDRVSPELAAETNAAKIHARLHREVREALAALSGA
jgi:hypothetical protein